MLIHVDPAYTTGPADHAPSTSALNVALEGLRWYIDWLRDTCQQVRILLPERYREEAAHLAQQLQWLEPIWVQSNGSAALPPFRRNDRIWIINAARLPMIDGATADAVLEKPATDILVFDPSAPAAANHYVESLLVGGGGELLRFERHYDDSPTFADRWSGEVSMLVTSREHAPSVVTQIVLRGWGLESIGALTRRFSVRWSKAASAHSGLETHAVVTGPIQVPPLGRTTSTTPRNDGPGPGALCSSTRSPSRTGAATPNQASGAAYLFAKRSIDVIAASLGLLVLSPLLILVALAVRLTSPGPALFGHKRQGVGGREFRCWKFRSMRQDADAMQAKLRALNEVDGPQFKIANDPRVTRVGNWLRKTNIDELPQLINVLLGEMSLVGPRPSPDKENQLCPAWRRTRLSVKPGISGLWQVLRRRNRPDSDFQEWIYYDVEYARHRSLWLDMQILLQTPISILWPQRMDAFAQKLDRHGICVHSDRLRAEHDQIAAQKNAEVFA